jgi:hypothetical protein
MRRIVLGVLALIGAAAAAHAQSLTISPNEVRSLAKDATVFGFPLVDGYRIQYSYFVDRGGPDFKSNWNTLVNGARVYTPDDKTIRTPNLDTAFSVLGADLRAEPLVITVPAVEKGRYYSLQFIDLYTFNFGYVGTRATGGGAGTFLLAGPNWNGTKLNNVRAVLKSETDFAFVVFRTQIFNPGDIDNVKRIQSGFRVQTLSQFLNTAAPAPAPTVTFVKPLTADQERTSLDFFTVLNFVLQFCPTNQFEEGLMARFARIGVGAGRRFDPNSLSPGMRQAYQDGMADAWKTLSDFGTSQIESGKLSIADGYGTRAHLNGNYLFRMASAAAGIYGNSKEEEIEPQYLVDADKQKLDGKYRYTLRFDPGRLPPVNAFWSLTMYQSPSNLLYSNSLNRYLINSSMLPGLKRDANDGVTLYVQKDSPGADKEDNWLPAPPGPFFIAMRLYWPKPDAYNGKWQVPPLQRVK